MLSSCPPGEVLRCFFFFKLLLFYLAFRVSTKQRGCLYVDSAYDLPSHACRRALQMTNVAKPKSQKHLF